MCDLIIIHASCQTITQDMQLQAQSQGEAAADLLEQLESTTVTGTLSSLRAQMWGIRMNLHTIVLPEENDTLFSKQGGWRSAFVTSRKKKDQLRVSVESVRHSICRDAKLMSLIRRLARPAVAKRHIVAKREAKAHALHQARFEAMIKAIGS